MGLVRMSGLVGPDEGHEETTFLVDTGAFYTTLPPALAARLGITSQMEAPVIMADNRRLRLGLSMVYLRLMEREAGIPVGVMDAPATMPDSTALEALALKVNPVRQELEYDRPFGPVMLELSKV